MMALVVAGIVLGIGVPSFRAFQRTNAMAAAANELVTAVLFARAEAVKRQAPVTLCATPDAAVDPPVCDAAGSNGAFIVFVDENGNGASDPTDANAAVDANEIVLLRRPAPGGAIQAWADSDYVTFGPNGFPRPAAGRPTGSATRLLFCDDRGNRPAIGLGSAARVVVLEPTGRPALRQEIDEVAAAAAALNAECPQ